MQTLRLGRVFGSHARFTSVTVLSGYFRFLGDLALSANQQGEQDVYGVLQLHAPSKTWNEQCEREQ